MPKLACRTCGRQVYTAAPLEAVSADERRCPRCGAYMDTERRDVERRRWHRRMDAMDTPGPREGMADRRVADRRLRSRRRDPSPGWAVR